MKIFFFRLRFAPYFPPKLLLNFYLPLLLARHSHSSAVSSPLASSVISFYFVFSLPISLYLLVFYHRLLCHPSPCLILRLRLNNVFFIPRINYLGTKKISLASLYFFAAAAFAVVVVVVVIACQSFAQRHSIIYLFVRLSIRLCLSRLFCARLTGQPDMAEGHVRVSN